MKGIPLVLFFTVLVVFSATAQSAIYKCIDEYGRPVYSATPTCQKPKEMDKISRQHQVKKKQEQEKKEKEEADNRKKQCIEAKTQLKKYKRAPFLTKLSKDENGKEVKLRLTDEETKEVILDAEKEVAYWCDGKGKDSDNQDN